MTNEDDGKRQEKMISRRQFLRGAGMTGAGLAAAACTPQIVEVEKEVAVEKIELQSLATKPKNFARRTVRG